MYCYYSSLLQMPLINLVPFGFTPTESRAYQALLELGPSTGYAVARALSVARANAYHALDGLVTKGTATAEGRPRLFRAVSPPALLALVTARAAERLDVLEQAIRAAGPAGGPALVRLEGERAYREQVLRTAAREPGPVVAVAPERLLAASLPVWRKRQADGVPTALWCVGAAPDFAVQLAGSVNADRARERLGGSAALVATPAAAIAVHLDGGLSGYWCSDPALTGAIRTAIHGLTEDAGS